MSKKKSQAQEAIDERFAEHFKARFGIEPDDPAIIALLNEYNDNLEFGFLINGYKRFPSLTVAWLNQVRSLAEQLLLALNIVEAMKLDKEEKDIWINTFLGGVLFSPVYALNLNKENTETFNELKQQATDDHKLGADNGLLLLRMLQDLASNPIGEPSATMNHLDGGPFEPLWERMDPIYIERIKHKKPQDIRQTCADLLLLKLVTFLQNVGPKTNKGVYPEIGQLLDYNGFNVNQLFKVGSKAKSGNKRINWMKKRVSRAREIFGQEGNAGTGASHEIMEKISGLKVYAFKEEE